MKRLPRGATLDMLLFHGAPDIIVGTQPVVLHEGIIENKKMNDLPPHTSTSPVPNQAGQLATCIYQSMVARYLNKILNNDKFDNVKGHGMLT